MTYNKLFINCDGGSRGNPGPAAIGIVIFNNEREKIASHKEKIGSTTNNVAEYKALIKALELAGTHTSGEVQVFMDSQVVVRQVNGHYQVRAEHLQELLKKVKEKEKKFSIISYVYVARTNKYQAQADKLVNEALDG
jgi:ribonuclease HI